MHFFLLTLSQALPCCCFCSSAPDLEVLNSSSERRPTLECCTTALPRPRRATHATLACHSPTHRASRAFDCSISSPSTSSAYLPSLSRAHSSPSSPSSSQSAPSSTATWHRNDELLPEASIETAITNDKIFTCLGETATFDDMGKHLDGMRARM